MRFAALVASAALAACSQQPAQSAVADLPACDTLELTGELAPAECQIEAAGQRLHVTFAALAEGATGGTVIVNVVSEDDQVLQTMQEVNVSEYHSPQIEDVDGDGRADVLLPLATGNVNTQKAVWIFNGERGMFERVGDVRGVSLERTSDGLIAVPARSSAVAWNIAFYKLDEGGLHPMATVGVEAPEGSSTTPTCALVESPGLRDLNLTEQEATARFCSESAAQVFE